MRLTNSQDLTKFLVEEWDYVPSQAPDVAEKLLRLESGLRIAFENWLETGQFSETPVFSGFSPQSLNDMVNIKPPAVFLLLDWIRREPVEATRAINEELVKK
jgi:hypothetical protein